jgi:N-acyl-D-amino-acid deacylase
MARHSLVLIFALLLAPTARADTPEPVRAAIEKGLKRIEQGTASYRKHRTCFSCHHQALPILSLTTARERGFAVSTETIQAIVDFSVKSFSKKEAIAKGQGIGGASTTAAYALTALAAAGHKPDDTTAALVEFLLIRQNRGGDWTAVANRPPSEGSPFTSTALTLGTLRQYAPNTSKKRVEQALSKGKDWLLASSPKTTEDKIFRLHGLTHVNADVKLIDSARDLLLGEQRGDGSWAQLADLAGDAYATGSALVVLRNSGVPGDHPAVQKGVKFLLSTQKDDGSWLVTTRSRPIQIPFDNGDPGGTSQFISFTATNWAVLALLETLPRTLPGNSK